MHSVPGIHLHVHSYYSFLEGLAAPEALARAAAQYEMPALALCDHGRLTGALEFYDACREQGIQPLLGLELDLATPGEFSAYAPAVTPLALLAQDLAGWGSLCRLSSLAQSDPAGNVPVSFEALAANSAGLICLSGGRHGLAAALAGGRSERPALDWLGRLAAAFPGRTYVQVQVQTPQDEPLMRRLWTLAGGAGLPAVAAHAVYYLLPEATALQRTAAAMRLNRPLERLDADEAAPPGAHFLAPDKLQQIYASFPGALAASDEIAARCQLELPLGRPHFPQVELPPGQTAMQALRQRAEAGARRLYAGAGGELPAEVSQRLAHELAVIETCGYEALFLVMQEIVNFARGNGIPIASRGSASSSLAAHCLGITTPDPVRLNLYFERFLNPARATPPDIDTDLCSRRRDEVIDFVYRRFGGERVAMVCTINRFRRRSALREVAKTYGLPPAEVSELAEALPSRWYGPPDRFAKAVLSTAEEPPFAELEQRYTTPRHRQIFQDAAALLGTPRHLSIHPGGVVIAAGRLTDLAPTQQAAKGVAIAQFDHTMIERLGLVKIDLLGIRGLTVLGDVAAALNAAAGDAAPGDNPPESAWITGRATVGAGGPGAADRNGQAVGPAMTSATAGANPAAEALTGAASRPDEPGAAAGTAAMRTRRTGRGTPGSGPSPLEALERIPADDLATADAVEHGRTIGCFQIESPGMRATLKEIRARGIDDIMAALALYRPGPLTGGLKDAFVARFRGLQPAGSLHPALDPLLGDTYGVILYQEQVLRIAHELAGLSLAEADLLRRAMSHFDPGKQMQTLQERFIAGAAARHQVPEATARRIWELMAAFAGYGFPKAHAASYAVVGWQAAWCKTHHPALFMAAVLANWGGYYSQRVYLTEARRMGLRLRPPQVNYAQAEFSVAYPDGETALFMGLNQVRELTGRTRGRILSERPFRSFNDFLARADPRPVEAENLVRAGALEGFGTIPALLQRLKGGGWRGGQLALFEPDGPAGEDWSLEQKVAAQEAVLGASLAAHPLELQAGRLAAAGAVSTVEAAARLGQRTRVAGMRQTWRRSHTARGDYIYFMALEDLEGMLEVVLSAEVYRRGRQALSSPGPYVIEGTVLFDEEKGEPFIRAERVEALRG